MSIENLFDHGYPDDPNESHYGLYQPVLDCIIFTVGYKEIAQEIKMLMSSKFSLHIYDLAHAENYQTGLIDNECCENWTISNKSSINITQSFRHNLILKAERLLQHQHKVDWAVDNEKKFMQLIIHYTKFSICLEREFYPWYQVESFMKDIDCDIPGQTLVETISKFRKSLRKTLYLGRDSILTARTIKDLVEDDNFLSRSYKEWHEKSSS